MKNRNIKTIIIFYSLTLAVLTSARAQQNIQFTQYIFNSMSINPAYAGYKEEWFTQMAVRSQWEGIDGAPRTGAFSIDGVADPSEKKIGLGLQLTTDKLGPQSSVAMYVNYAYRLQLNTEDTKRLSFGIGVGVTNYSLDGTMLTTIDADDRELPIGQVGSYIPDARFGIYYNSPKFYIGTSILDLFSGDHSNGIFNWDAGETENLKRRRHAYIIAGTLNQLTNGLKLRPSLLIKEDFKGPTSIDIGTMFVFDDRLWLGGSYRAGFDLWKKNNREDISLKSSNSISAIAQFYISNKFRIGYSYDYALSGLRTHQTGSHEITLGLSFGHKFERIISPRFF